MPPRLNETPTITVCVTCYNQRTYVGDCLDGILAQDVDAPIEILVGDDSSSDGSIEVIEKYAHRDDRIQLLRRPFNLGFVENQRDLFARARGEFVAICEADDFWIDPQKLRRQLEIMRSRPSTDLCITAGLKVSEDKSKTLGEFRISSTSRELTMPEIIAAVSNKVPMPSLLIRRAALEALPQETYRQVIIDYSLQVLLGLNGDVWYDAARTSACRIVSRGSWTEGLASSSEKFLKHHEALRAYQQFLEGQLGAKWSDDLRRAFEPLILGFYMSSRINAADKRRNLPDDVPRLSVAGQFFATLLTRAPVLVLAGAFARRRIWRPFRELAIGMRQ